MLTPPPVFFLTQKIQARQLNIGLYQAPTLQADWKTTKEHKICAPAFSPTCAQIAHEYFQAAAFNKGFCIQMKFLVFFLRSYTCIFLEVTTAAAFLPSHTLFLWQLPLQLKVLLYNPCFPRLGITALKHKEQQHHVISSRLCLYQRSCYLTTWNIFLSHAEHIHSLTLKLHNTFCFKSLLSCSQTLSKLQPFWQVSCSPDICLKLSFCS